MLNKTAEKVLKCIIKKSNGNLDELISISHKDFKNKKITNTILNSMCQQLYDDGYIGTCYPSCEEDDDIDLILKYVGYSYFDNKRIEIKKLWLKNAWIPIIVAFATTVLTNYLLPRLPCLLKLLSDILSKKS